MVRLSQWNTMYNPSISELPPSSSEEESEEEEDAKPKGVEHLIDIANPNRTGAKDHRKVSDLADDGKPQLSRRER